MLVASVRSGHAASQRRQPIRRRRGRRPVATRRACRLSDGNRVRAGGACARAVGGPRHLRGKGARHDEPAHRARPGRRRCPPAVRALAHRGAGARHALLARSADAGVAAHRPRSRRSHRWRTDRRGARAFASDGQEAARARRRASRRAQRESQRACLAHQRRARAARPERPHRCGGRRRALSGRHRIDGCGAHVARSTALAGGRGPARAARGAARRSSGRDRFRARFGVTRPGEAALRAGGARPCRGRFRAAARCSRPAASRRRPGAQRRRVP